MPKGHAVNRMFGAIASKYERANKFLSGGVDRLWRRKLVQLVAKENPSSIADLATGSGDVAFALERKLSSHTSIQGLDFCQGMLDIASKNATHRNSKVTFGVGDCMDLPLPDHSIDVVTIAFGFRNFEDRAKGLREMKRILKPGGSLFILEFSQPNRFFRPFYYCYLKCILPSIARLLTGNREAYEYLAGSIEDFPDKENVSEEIRSQGLRVINTTSMTGGIVAIHHARSLSS